MIIKHNEHAINSIILFINNIAVAAYYHCNTVIILYYIVFARSINNTYANRSTRYYFSNDNVDGGKTSKSKFYN